jgi:endogenous inhibitor of DNA gyrase (YacG/DUF329 family)
MATLTVTCPFCQRETEWDGNPNRPFCSTRCRMMDLGNWAAERYRVPGPSVEPDEKSDEEE